MTYGRYIACQIIKITMKGLFLQVDDLVGGTLTAVNV